MRGIQIYAHIISFTNQLIREIASKVEHKYTVSDCLVPWYGFGI